MTSAEPTTGLRYKALDSLRGVCACMIVLFHFGIETRGVIGGCGLVQHSFLFVDFFFVLSGFVIAASYGDRLANGFSIGRFMGLRLGRIYPLHLAILLLFLAFECLFASGALGRADRRPFHDPNDPASFLASLALVQTFLSMNSQGWNNPSWSIQVEIWTYLLYAGIFRWLDRYLVPVTLLLAFGCACYVAHFAVRWINVNQQGAYARCIYGFSLGVLAYRVHRHQKMEMTTALASMLEIGAVAATAAVVAALGASPLSMFIPPLFFLVILIFAQQRGVVSTFLEGRVPQLLGTLSFSIYMIHRFLVYRVINLLSLIEAHSHHRLSLVSHYRGATSVGGSPLFGDVMTVTFLFLVIACAQITYQLIEIPGQRWSRRLILGAHPKRLAMTSESEAPTF